MDLFNNLVGKKSDDLMQECIPRMIGKKVEEQVTNIMDKVMKSDDSKGTEEEKEEGKKDDGDSEGFDVKNILSGGGVEAAKGLFGFS